MEIGRLENGSYVIKGSNFDQFYDDYHSDFSYKKNDSEIIETISPTLIEGIELGESDIDNPNSFWEMHASIKDFFIKTASNIPIIQSELSKGKSLEEIRQNPSLQKCVDLFFNPKNIIRVTNGDGYYRFDSDGRHRIIAARELGFNIPVKVIGAWIRKIRRSTNE